MYFFFFFLISYLTMWKKFVCLFFKHCRDIQYWIRSNRRKFLFLFVSNNKIFTCCAILFEDVATYGITYAICIFGITSCRKSYFFFSFLLWHLFMCCVCFVFFFQRFSAVYPILLGFRYLSSALGHWFAQRETDYLWELLILF